MYARKFDEKLLPLYCMGLNQIVMVVRVLAMLSGNRGQRAKFAKDTQANSLASQLNQKIYSRSSGLFTFAK